MKSVIHQSLSPHTSHLTPHTPISRILSHPHFLTKERDQTPSTAMGTLLVSWAAAPYAAALLFFLVSYFVVYPFVEYIRDPKGKQNHGAYPRK